MSSLYYLDGYNVIHHSSLLKPLAMQNFEAARDALIEKAARFSAATGHRVKIVFDGRGKRAEPLVPIEGVSNVEVMYSKGEHSADTLIERIVYNAADRRSMVIVSGDVGIRSVCRGLGALVMSPDNFLAGVREADENSRVTLRNIQPPDTERRLENRLDESSSALLADLKDSLGE